jgi:hypothetical protein
MSTSLNFDAVNGGGDIWQAADFVPGVVALGICITLIGRLVNYAVPSCAG